MNNLENYIKAFFSDLQIYEDIKNKKKYKDGIYDALKSFISNPNMETALEVYNNYFQAYWIDTKGEKNLFLELIENMKLFEENAGVLIRKQRDHYMHSVYVFLLGIAVYQQGGSFQKNFNNKILNDLNYRDAYTTEHEEFFYRWGITSLFHDIAYPLEIIINQANEYMKFISNPMTIDAERLKVNVNIDNINYFNELPNLIPLEEFSEEFKKKYPECGEMNLEKSTEILAHKISMDFNLKVEDIRESINMHIENMRKNCFIDHGYYSGLIVLRWFHDLIQKNKWNPSYFYFPIVDIASAILLHNYYQRVLMDKPINIGKFEVEKHPIAYLLKLCDELQDWNRTAYGKKDKECNLPVDYKVTITNDILEIIYKFDGEFNKEEFISRKKSSISNVLNIEKIFNKGLIIDAEVRNE